MLNYYCVKLQYMVSWPNRFSVMFLKLAHKSVNSFQVAENICCDCRNLRQSLKRRCEGFLVSFENYEM